MKAIDRLLAKTDRSGECWLWTGAVNRGAGGYGWFAMQGGQTLAHRASWLLHNGPIAPGLHVLHRCDVRLCVNPAHLFLGTNADNVADKVAKGRTARGESHATRLAPSDIREIRAATGTIRQIGARFGVAYSHVARIRRGEIWRSVS